MGRAVFSDCGNYRLRLERDIQMDGIVIGFLGVNPSMAGVDDEDATTRKWIGFSKILGARMYIAGNPFARIATDVKELAACADPYGHTAMTTAGEFAGLNNDAHLARIVADSDVLIPCWGNRGKLPPNLRPRLEWLAKMLRESGKPIRIFGLTKSGDPMHPLMLGYNTQLTDWRP